MTGTFSFYSVMFILLLNSIETPEKMNVPQCSCDTIKTKSIILSKSYNSISQYDTVLYSQSQFDSLSDSIKTALWYRDIENINSTQFTNFWSTGRFMKLSKTIISDSTGNAKPNNSNHLFLDHFFKRKDIEIAFQFGPTLDLSGYHYFIVKKLECCFIITHSYKRHGRFIFKSYAIVDKQKLDSLYFLLRKIKTQALSEKESTGYTGYFADNRNNKKFFVDFDKETAQGDISNSYHRRPKKEIQDLYNFLDKKINWYVTYQL